MSARALIVSDIRAAAADLRGMLDELLGDEPGSVEQARSADDVIAAALGVRRAVEEAVSARACGELDAVVED